jgi:hypothetical protein
MGATVQGLDSLTADIRGAVSDVESLDVTPLASAALAVMRPLIPRKSGALGDSARAGADGPTALVTIGSHRVAYARVIRYGNPRRGIRPARFVERTEAAIDTKATTVLEDQWNTIATKRGLA